MMKRDKVVFENEKFEVTGYDIWMTAGEIASLFGVTIMKVRGIINRIRKQLTVNLDLLSKYDLLESGYMDELYNLECIIWYRTTLTQDWRMSSAIGYATELPSARNVQ